MALSQRPLAAAVYAEPMQFYKSGILASNCSGRVDHGVLVVGYDSDSYTIKNSWGESWGESMFGV